MEYQLWTSGISVESPIEQVFANRGIQPQDIYHYLNTTKEDVLDPTLFINMDRGAKMLLGHILRGHKIFIQIDSDADGYTSSAALINYLNYYFPGTVQNNITYRIHEGKQHGVILDTIPEGTKLVILPDSGSSQVIEHEAIHNMGMDLLILDHHESEWIMEYGCRINNQTCDYPNKTLSGVGVVYKFCQYLDTLINKEPHADDILDLVAIGMVADVMQLTEYETRELIKEGTNNIINPFLKEWVNRQAYSLKGEVTPFGISFYIAPYINAVIRLGTLEEKMILFESMLNFKAYELIPSTKRGCKGQLETRVEQACRNCNNIKSRQTKARDLMLEKIHQKIKDEGLLSLPILIVQIGEPIEENLTGLIANQIANDYQRPTLLLNGKMEINGDTGEILNWEWRGSGRNIQFSKLTNMREFLLNSGLVELAEGHASAFGVVIKQENMNALKEYIARELKDFDFQKTYKVDFIWHIDDLYRNRETVMDIGGLNWVWGQGVPEPQIAIEHIVVTPKNLTLMSPDNRPTLKIQLDNISLIKFKSSKEEYEKLYSEGTTTINIIGTCNINEWNGNYSPQIFIEDYEIVSKTDYYF